MIFDELATLDEVIGSVKSRVLNFKDANDPEVDRLFNSSPPIGEIAATFDSESIFRTNEKETARTDVSDQENENPAKNETNSRFGPDAVVHELFVPVKVTKGTAKTSSCLSSMFESKITANAETTASNMTLTIYLPDCSPMELAVSENDTFDVVIKKVLKQHLKEGRLPELVYDCPEIYELRMHEGDGEPDRDFPALDKSKTLKDFNLNEYCLCESDDDFNPSSRISDDDRDRMASRNSGSSVGDPLGDVITVNVPNVGQLRLPFTPENTFNDLLPAVAEQVARKGQKLRLHNDEFAFIVSSEDQAKHKLVSQCVTLDTLVRSITARKFELQKRIFADSVRMMRQMTSRNILRQDGDQQIVYNDALANVYQEWNVVKKNKFGRKQERVIGIDGKMVYNSKREKTNASSVYRAQRDLSTIRKVEVVEGDPLTLRITWEEENNSVIYDMEYTCDSEKDCREIVAKLTYLINRRRFS